MCSAERINSGSRLSIRILLSSIKRRTLSSICLAATSAISEGLQSNATISILLSVQ
uniref:Uncharacterized protein n=1 Tax=Parascaris equorum TaxID=6256 RepID=A0A914R839_PAREQ